MAIQIHPHSTDRHKNVILFILLFFEIMNQYIVILIHFSVSGFPSTWQECTSCIFVLPCLFLIIDQILFCNKFVSTENIINVGFSQTVIQVLTTFTHLFYYYIYFIFLYLRFHTLIFELLPKKKSCGVRLKKKKSESGTNACSVNVVLETAL